MHVHELLRVVHEPLHEFDLVVREVPVLHALGPHGEGVEVRHDGFDVRLRVRDQQTTRVHRLDAIMLHEDDLGRRVPSEGVQVHVHERRFGVTPRLPPDHGADDLAPHVPGVRRS